MSMVGGMRSWVWELFIAGVGGNFLFFDFGAHPVYRKQV